MVFIKVSNFYNLKKVLGCLISHSKLINNVFFNINRGYTCYVRIKGVGYKMDFINSDVLSINLGFSHILKVCIPYYIKIIILKKRVII